MNTLLKGIVRKYIGESRYEQLQFMKKEKKYSARNGKFYCPCCDNRVGFWVSFKDFFWEEKFNETKFNAGNDVCICPICDSAPRHRIEASWLNEISLSNPQILLWAAEKCIRRYLDNKKIKYVTADMYDLTADKQENIECSGFEDDSFDLIICNHVLEHVDNVAAALDDTFRIIKPKGAVLIMVPLDASLECSIEEIGITTEEQRKKLYGQADHVRLFGRDFEDKLLQSGFKVEKYIGDLNCNSDILPIIGPASYDSNILYVCKKDK